MILQVPISWWLEATHGGSLNANILKTTKRKRKERKEGRKEEEQREGEKRLKKTFVP